jgi:hypothetical protein
LHRRIRETTDRAEIRIFDRNSSIHLYWEKQYWSHAAKKRREIFSRIVFEPHALAASELENGNPFVKEILRTGKEIKIDSHRNTPPLSFFLKGISKSLQLPLLRTRRNYASRAFSWPRRVFISIFLDGMRPRGMASRRGRVKVLYGPGRRRGDSGKEGAPFGEICARFGITREILPWKDAAHEAIFLNARRPLKFRVFMVQKKEFPCL